MKHPSKITLLIIGILLVSSWSVLTQTINAEQQENEKYPTTIETINAETYQTLENIVATPFYCSPFAGTSTPMGYSPDQIRNAYNLPSSGGIGKTIAIIDAFHAPTLLADYTAFCKEFNLPDNSSGNLLVHTMPGATVNASWLPETCLDVEWAHAIAPNATILLIEAKDAKVSSLFDAVEYAADQSGVVAISMSWGISEIYLTKNDEIYLDNNYFNKANIIYFASSGDSGAEINYPAVSPNVVGVGGTKLLLNSDGTVKSETAWSGSGGGVSLYESRPSYQTSYGINTAKRCVPDVSFNADPNTGVSVYCDGSWKVYGGTSAGAPQWAAIHALSLSASNNNLYNRAKTAYASYFRDIIAGSNGYSAGIGYDCVTGLGSPLTFDFNDRLEVSPVSGGVGTNITLTGKGLLGTSANITYLNPFTSTWESIANNTSITSGCLSYNTTAPDLMATIASGDNSQTADQIIFRVTNSTGYSYNTTVPFSEYRRGLSQVGSQAATNIYGNNTSFGTAVLPQSGNSLSFSGRWFTPAGNLTLLWDAINLGNATVDQTGTFSANITVPTSAAGYHTLTIQDNGYNFSINIASQPTLTNDYNGQWQTGDFIINLSADSTVDTIYYRINNGTTQNMTEAGQPVITTSDSNNTLEYWCNWTLNGISLETAHQFVAKIKLDKTAPVGQVMVNPTTSTREITLHLSAVDPESGVTQMCFSNDGNVFSGWETFASTYSWTLTGAEGKKMIVAKFLNGAGLASTDAVEITLDIPDPTTAPQATTSINPTAAPQTQTTTPTNSPIEDPTATPVPEFSVGTVLVLLALATLVLGLFAKKRQTGDQ